MIAICYNVANSETWKKIFKINNLEDIINLLIKNYNINYDGKKNCNGWYSDQQILYNYLIEFKKNNDEIIIILNDKKTGYNRLDGKSSNKLNLIKKNKSEIIENINSFSDFHIIRNYHKNIDLLENIITNIIS